MEGEISYKVNREVMLMVDQPAICDRLSALFLLDWAMTTQ
jgi:hypothetical protein